MTTSSELLQELKFVNDKKILTGKTYTSDDLFSELKNNSLMPKDMSFNEQMMSMPKSIPSLSVNIKEQIKRATPYLKPKYETPIIPDYINQITSGQAGKELIKPLTDVVPRQIKIPAKEFLSGLNLEPTGGSTSMARAIGLGVAASPLGMIGGKVKPAIEAEAKIVPTISLAVKNIMKALDAVEPLRAEQSILYSKELGKRAKALAEIGATIPGEKGFYAKLSQLKGELPKVKFESIKDKISQPDIDSLYKMVEDSNVLGVFDKIGAQKSLSKILGVYGVGLPTKSEISLLGKVFPKEFIETLESKNPIMGKIWETLGEVVNIPRSIMSSIDLSAPLRQGAFLIGRPKQWIPAFKEMFKYAFDEKAYLNLEKELQTRPSYELMKDSKLALTEIGGSLSNREESFISRLPEKIPIFGSLFKGSNRAYAGFLNKLRADVFDDLLKKAELTGATKEYPDVINNISKFVNSATGRGSLGKLDESTAILNGIFFSPRLIMSRLNLLNPAFYINLDPFTRKEALKSLFSFAGIAATTLGLAKMGGSELVADPRNSDFGKIKIGKTRIDTLGGFQQYSVFLSRWMSNSYISSTTNKITNLGEGYKPTSRMDIAQRLLENKFSPLASFALGMAKGKTMFGDKFNAPAEILNRFMPMIGQDLYDLYKEGGLKDTGLVIPGIFGASVQTYGEAIPMEGKTPSGKPTIEWKQSPSLGEAIVNKITGVKLAPTPIKETFNKIQLLVKEGKIPEAQGILNNLSDKDYEIYKKIKQRDIRMTETENEAKVYPIFLNIQDLLKKGKDSEAQKLLNFLTDREYLAYKNIKKKEGLFE